MTAEVAFLTGRRGSRHLRTRHNYIGKFIKVICAYSAFADHNESAKRKNAPWFRVIFAIAKIELGEAQEVLIKSRSDGSDKTARFLPLFATFSLKEKKLGNPIESLRLSL